MTRRTAPRPRLLSALLALGVAAVAGPVLATGSAVAAPPQPSTVTQILVWGDSMTQNWPTYLSHTLGVPVYPRGVGGDDIQETQDLFDAWVAAATSQQLAGTAHLCWCGHVNTNRAHDYLPDRDEDTIVPVLTEMAARVPTGHFMPIGLTNQPAQPLGSTGYQTIVGINADIAAAFPDRYAEVRRYLVTDGLTVARLTATTQDQSNIAADVPPQSLRVTSGNLGHLNDTGKVVAAVRMTDLIRGVGWVAPVGTRTEPTLVLTSSAPTPAPYGTALRMTATISATSGSPSGYVHFQIDGASMDKGVPLAAGSARSPWRSNLSAGEHRYRCYYFGDSAFTFTIAEYVHTVSPVS